MPKLVRVLSENLTHERLDGEVIVIDLQTGLYYSMTGSAADLWSLASGGVPVDAWVSALEVEFTSPVPSADIDTFIQSLVDNRLVQICDEADTRMQTPPVLPADYNRGPWTPPVIELFEDLQDLILVDPIHDVSQEGWPHRD